MIKSERIAAFIDRDGVINTELNYVHRIEDFHLLPRAVEGLRQLAAYGYKLVVVTNQAGIAKGLYDEADYLRLTQHMVALLQSHSVLVQAVYHCPHHPQGTVKRYSIVCSCRKPAPGMLLLAAAEHNINLSRSVMIGDKLSDIEAGWAAGVRFTVLVDSGHVLPVDACFSGDRRCADLASAAEWICSQPKTTFND